MSIQIDLELGPESEDLLRALAEEAGVDVDSYVRQVIKQRLSEPVSGNGSDGFVDNLDEWIRLHPVRKGVADDSRESIYEGCGE